MVDFTNLDQYKVTSANVKEYPLVEIAGEASLMVRSCNEGNSGYMNGLLRITGQDDGGRRSKQSKGLSADKMDETREYDRELYPEHVITGWSGVVDAEGKEVKYSVKVCREFLNALPDWIFDRIRIYVSDPENFLNKIDSAGKAKN